MGTDLPTRMDPSPAVEPKHHMKAKKSRFPVPWNVMTASSLFNGRPRKESSTDAQTSCQSVPKSLNVSDSVLTEVSARTVNVPAQLTSRERTVRPKIQAVELLPLVQNL